MELSLMNWSGKYWKQASMNKTSIHLLLSIVAVVITVWFGWLGVKARGADWLPIKYVRIEGAFQYIVKDKIKQVLKKHVISGLYNADIQKIQKSVDQLPWIESVKVKRVWPDAIDIKIVEQTPVVRWGGHGLLNPKGEKFIPDNMSEFSQLPKISGPIGNEKKLLEVMKGLTVALNDQKMAIAEFHVNDRRAWAMKLKNGMNLKLGRNNPLTKFQQFLQTLTLFDEELIKKVDVVDLRYPNGYALTWKQGEQEFDWEKMRKI